MVQKEQAVKTHSCDFVILRTSYGCSYMYLSTQKITIESLAVSMLVTGVPLKLNPPATRVADNSCGLLSRKSDKPVSSIVRLQS